MGNQYIVSVFKTPEKVWGIPPKYWKSPKISLDKKKKYLWKFAKVMFSQVSCLSRGEGRAWQERRPLQRAVRILLECILVITARKRSLGQGNIFSSVCQEFCTQWGGGSQHALQVVSQHALQVVSQQAWGVSRPSSRGEVEESGQGGSPGPHPRGISRPTWGGVSQHALRQTPPVDGYPRGRYASYWNAFLLIMTCVKILQDSTGRVTCPILRAYTCPNCGANGDIAHTVKYCPMSPNEVTLLTHVR